MQVLAQAIALTNAFALAAPAEGQASDQPAVAVETPTAAALDPHAAMVVAFGQDTLENGKFLWKDGTSEVDRLVLNLSEQRVYAYDAGNLVAVSTVSTGRRGHETRPGSFSILAKYRYYRSRKYDNAPMPYMQQITSYGVALHAGPMPGYPASHGCIRLPTQFAANLFAATHIGVPVLVTP
ncbi:MAG TPA: L,D-transpeptidase family protein [Croceibacterium sp.]|nr:L,D-transpeptidase family protein [Croceibacterium sp.]